MIQIATTYEHRVYTHEEVMEKFAAEREWNTSHNNEWRNFYTNMAEKAYLANIAGKIEHGKAVMHREISIEKGMEYVTDYYHDGTSSKGIYSCD